MSQRSLTLHACHLIIGLTLCTGAKAQFEKLLDSTKRAAEREVTNQVEDAVEGAVTCAVNDEKCPIVRTCR